MTATANRDSDPSDADDKRKWELNQEGFERLLAAFGPDRDRAAAELVHLREKLAVINATRTPYADQLADEAIDRTARKLEQLRIDNVGGYAYRVARFVLKELLRAPEAKGEPLDAHSIAAPTTETAEVGEADRQRREWRLDCMHACLDQMAPADREFVRAYLCGESENIERRKQMAAARQLTTEALRSRVSRLLKPLRVCIDQCTQRKEHATELQSDHSMWRRRG